MLTKIFDCFREQLEDSFEIAAKMFNISGGDLADFFMNLIVENINGNIDGFLNSLNLNLINVRLFGISGLVYCIASQQILFRNFSLKLASFVELYGVIYLKHLVEEKKVKYLLNEQTGYDNWMILDINDLDTVAIYIRCYGRCYKTNLSKNWIASILKRSLGEKTTTYVVRLLPQKKITNKTSKVWIIISS